ncbi:hypothetical protein [Aquabacter cavernae]|nr:hypothetical protein [Aquabacter cavernae]
MIHHPDPAAFSAAQEAIAIPTLVSQASRKGAPGEACLLRLPAQLE